MSTADGERIAPVTYLFRSRPEEAGSDDEARSPSAATPEEPAAVREAAGPEQHAAPEPTRRSPVFVDLGADQPADERVTSLRAELEREAREHVSAYSAPAEKPRKASFAPISNVSMHALARRGMSSREMRDYLRGREFEPGAVDDEVERLESVALLDDVALGETLVRTLRDRKGLGRSALTAELRRRQLDSTAIEIAMEGLDDDELEKALEIAHKRAAQLRSYDTDTATRRLSAFLMRKGYSGSVVSTAVQRALAPSGGPVFR